MLPGRIIAGGLLLILGRKLFWLFVALLGFATGLTVATSLFHIEQEWLQLIIGIAFGIVGALLAYFLQEIAITVAGFLAGAYVATILARNFIQNADVLTWVLFFIGGIVGAILMATLFDWALIILSSLAGALLITEGMHLANPLSWLVTLGLFILGIIIQANMERPVRPTGRRISTN
jgi:hypothetical protein